MHGKFRILFKQVPVGTLLDVFDNTRSKCSGCRHYSARVSLKIAQASKFTIFRAKRAPLGYAMCFVDDNTYHGAHKHFILE
jgi:hypothetical protein